MALKGGNAKKESGRAKKAENEAVKNAAADDAKEAAEAAKWSKGGKSAKSKGDDKAEKRAAELARKEENARLLAAEEASAPSKPKAAPKAGANKAGTYSKNIKPAGPGAIAAGGGLDPPSAPTASEGPKEVESFAATGIDNMLDLLEVVNAKMDKASVGTQAANIERHPERRFKAAFNAFKERELPKLKLDHPGLRLKQYEEILYKEFQKSPDNPFNQTTVSYDASKEERLKALDEKKSEVTERLKQEKEKK